MNFFLTQLKKKLMQKKVRLIEKKDVSEKKFTMCV